MRVTASGGRQILAACLSVIVWLSLTVVFASAQIFAEDERNVSQMANFQNECAIAINPSNRDELFVACNKEGAGLFFARSVDRGHSWIYPDADKALADGHDAFPLACCDPSVAWDSFGNLYLTYLIVDTAEPDEIAGLEALLSVDGGQTFQHLWTIAGSVDQPTVVAANTPDPGAPSPVAVWIVWNFSSNMRAIGAPVTGSGQANIGPFPMFPEDILDTTGCSFGDVAIAPDGTVVQVCQAPVGSETDGHIQTHVDPDGLGSQGFEPRIMPDIDVSVGGIDSIPAQHSKGIDAEAGLAYDRNPASPHYRRLYLVYTDEVPDESDDTDIMLRYSNDNGRTWSSPPIRVNDDTTVRSQFLPRIAVNPSSGNIMVCWHDARNSLGNNQMQEFCSVSTPTSSAPSFFPNGQVGAGTSSGTGSSSAGPHDIEYGDYSGLDYLQGRAHPVWADQSNVTGDNPDGTTKWEAESSRVGGGVMASEGEPHITTVDGVRYDFQADGDFVAARAADGFEVQLRQKAVPTTYFPEPNLHTGLATCVSINSAVAARVGTHRVTYQQSLEANTDLELRIDGNLAPLSDDGVELSGGGRVLRSAVGGMEIEFPNGALLSATPGFWGPLGRWYLNVNIADADAYEGLMGARPAGSWLPTLPDGTSLGTIPASLTQRYDGLYRTFADAWRVPEGSSLFEPQPTPAAIDLAAAAWPKAAPPCTLGEKAAVEPAKQGEAEEACHGLADYERRRNCVFDVALTGEAGFAKTYLETERLERWGTTTMLSAEMTRGPDVATRFFLATAVPRWPFSKEPLKGSVQFYAGSKPAGEPVELDGDGRATWIPKDFDWQSYEVTARYIPAKESEFLTSLSGKVGTTK
jgi:hypothetical protein